jgi:hypothetical protein
MSFARGKSKHVREYSNLARGVSSATIPSLIQTPFSVIADVLKHTIQNAIPYIKQFV